MGEGGQFARECSLAGSAAGLSLFGAFLLALMGLSSPSHITGYTLSTPRQNVLIWLPFVFGMAYGILASQAFYRTMTIATSPPFVAKLDSDLEKTEVLDIEDMDEAPVEAKLHRLKGTNRNLMLLTYLFSLSTLALWYFVLRPLTHAAWEEHCLARPNFGPEDALESTCAEEWLNQRLTIWIHIGVPPVLDLFRYKSTRDFIRLNLDVIARAKAQVLNKSTSRRSRRG